MFKQVIMGLALIVILPLAAAKIRAQQIGLAQQCNLIYEGKSCYDPTAAFTRAKMSAGDSRQTDCFTARAEGQMEIVKLSSRSDASTISITFRNLRLDITREGGESSTEQISEARSFALIAAPFRIKAFGFDPGTTLSTFQRSLLKVVAGSLQFGASPQCLAKRSAQACNAIENNPLGQYQASYLPDETEADGSTYRKTIARYLSLVGATPESPEKKVIPNGQLVIRYDHAKQQLLEVSGEYSESTTVEGREFGNHKATIRIKGRNSVRLSSSLFRQLLTSSRAWRKTARSLSAQDSETERFIAEAKTILARQSRQQILDSAKTVTNSQAETAIARGLWALALLDAEACRQMGILLIELPHQHPAFPLLIGALAKSGNLSSQRALGLALKGANQIEKIVALAAALGDVKKPLPESERVLLELACSDSTDKRLAAGLALGAIARSLKENAPRRAQWIIKQMERRFAGQSVEERQALIDILGNAGSASSLNFIKRNAVDEDPQIRASAIAALRHMPAKATQSLLLDALEKDEIAAVRIEAAAALNYHKADESLVSALSSAYKKEPVSSVRLAMLHILSGARKKFADAQSTICIAAESDSDADIREAASQLILKKAN